METAAIPAHLRAWTITADAALGVGCLLPRDGVHHTWRVLRCLVLWIAERCAEVPPFDGRGMQALEEQILTSTYDDRIRLPLAVIARSLTPGADDADVERMAYACLCAAEWAHGHGLYSVATSFADASALATGLDRYAEVAARLRRAVETRAESRSDQVRGTERLGEAVAERILDGVGEDGVARQVVVRIGRPRPDPEPGGGWGCPTQIVGIGQDDVLVAYGHDAVQALQLAFEMIGARLAHPPEPVALTWLGEGDLGFSRPSA